MARSYPHDAMDHPPFPVDLGSGVGSSAPYDPGPESYGTEEGVESCAVFWVDLAGRVTRWAESCEAVFGRSSDSRPARFEDLFVPDDQRHGIPGLILRHARDVGSWDGAGWRVRQGGAPFWAASSVNLVRTPNGLEIGYMIVTRDLSQLRTYEDEAPQDERARLATLGRVASEVSHDVRNILAAIRGFASALEQLDPTNSASNVVREELLKACDRGTMLTQKLLGVGSGSAGLSEPTDVNQLVRETEPLLRQVLPSRIELRVRLQPDLPVVKARSDDAELALLNLVLNARDAIPHSGVIEVSSARVGALGAVLTVRDTGAGMSPEVLERCRERSFTTKGEADGSGLGLAIVQEAAREFGGSFHIDSAPGVGTTATIAFPPAEGSPTGRDSISARSREPATASVVALWSGSPIASELLAGVLRRNGFTVASVDSVESAREMVTRYAHRIRVLVVDGLDSARLSAPLLPLLCCETTSILLSDAAVDGAEGRQFDQQLVGPIDPDALLACVVEAVDRSEDRGLRSVH